MDRSGSQRFIVAGMSMLMLSGCAGAGAAPAVAPGAGYSPAASTQRSQLNGESQVSEARRPRPASGAAISTTRPGVPAAFEIGDRLNHANGLPGESADNRSAEAWNGRSINKDASDRPAEANPRGATGQKSAALVDQFDAQLERIIHDRGTSDSFITAPTEERDLINAVLAAISEFRGALRDESGLLADKSAPMLALSQRIAEQIPLTIPTLDLCRSVQQFGVYDPFEPARFVTGAQTPVVIYCEVEHFRSRQSEDQWETKLSYEAVLYSDSDHPMAVLSKKPANIIDRCRNRRRDFFLADRMTLPASLPAGKYLLKVTVIDQLANHVAEKSAPIVIAAK